MTGQSNHVKVTDKTALRAIVDVISSDVSDLFGRRKGVCTFRRQLIFCSRCMRDELNCLENLIAQKNLNAGQVGALATMFDAGGSNGYHALHKPMFGDSKRFAKLAAMLRQPGFGEVRS